MHEFKVQHIHCCNVLRVTMEKYYHIALNFRGSKFLQMAVFEDFVEIISRIHCLNNAHTTHIMYECGIQAKFCHTVSSSQLLANLHFDSIFLESLPCGFGSIQHSPGMLSIDSLARKSSSIHVKIYSFANG